MLDENGTFLNPPSGGVFFHCQNLFILRKARSLSIFNGEGAFLAVNRLWPWGMRVRRGVKVMGRMDWCLEEAIKGGDAWEATTQKFHLTFNVLNGIRFNELTSPFYVAPPSVVIVFLISVTIKMYLYICYLCNIGLKNYPTQWFFCSSDTFMNWCTNEVERMFSIFGW